MNSIETVVGPKKTLNLLWRTTLTKSLGKFIHTVLHFQNKMNLFNM